MERSRHSSLTDLLESGYGNGLVQSWPEIMRLARESASAAGGQGTLFEEAEA